VYGRNWVSVGVGCLSGGFHENGGIFRGLGWEHLSGLVSAERWAFAPVVYAGEVLSGVPSYLLCKMSVKSDNLQPSYSYLTN